MSTLKIEIMGKGCKKCHQLEENALAAISALSLEAEILHITDEIEIAKRGVMSTPALAINGRVVSKGQVLLKEQIQQILS